MILFNNGFYYFFYSDLLLLNSLISFYKFNGLRHVGQLSLYLKYSYAHEESRKCPQAVILNLSFTNSKHIGHFMSLISPFTSFYLMSSIY